MSQRDGQQIAGGREIVDGADADEAKGECADKFSHAGREEFHCFARFSICSFIFLTRSEYPTKPLAGKKSQQFAPGVGMDFEVKPAGGLPHLDGTIVKF